MSYGRNKMSYTNVTLASEVALAHRYVKVEVLVKELQERLSQAIASPQSLNFSWLGNIGGLVVSRTCRFPDSGWYVDVTCGEIALKLHKLISVIEEKPPCSRAKIVDAFDDVLKKFENLIESNAHKIHIYNRASFEGTFGLKWTAATPEK